MNFRIYANGTDVTQYVSRQSLRITEALNNRANICEFATLNYKITQSSIIHVYEGFELRADVSASDTLLVSDTFKRFENFKVDDEIIVDPMGTRQFVVINDIDHVTKEIQISDNITASAGTFVGRLIFAGTVERNPDEQIGYSENFEHFLTVSDRTVAMNRKNVVDVYDDMYGREILGRMIYRFCATDTSIVLDTLDAARTEAGVARVMNDDTSDLVEGTASQSTGITGAGTATRTKTITTQDITDATHIRLRHKITTSNANKITSMKVRVGNDASNYFERNSSFIGSTDENCRNYNAFIIERATEVGTVNVTAIDRVQIEVVGTASITAGGILFDEMTATSGGFTIDNDCVRGTRQFTRINGNYDKATNILEDITKKQGLFRRVDYEKKIKMFESNDEQAPFEITDTSRNYGNLSIKADTSMLRNRQVVRGGEAASNVLFEQILVADGQQKSFLLAYKPKDLTVEVDSGGGYVAKTVGVENLVDESTVDFVFNFQEKVVRNANLATLSAGHKIKFTYYPYQAIRVIVSDPASIAAMKALAGGDGIFDGPAISETTITSFDDARKRARAEIQAYANPVVSADFVTEQGGLHAGQVIRIQDTSRTLDQDFLIQRVVRNSVDGAKSRYQVECASTMFGLIEFFQLLLKKAGKTGEDASELVDIIIAEDETITITFDATFTQKSDTFEATATMKKVFDFIEDEGTATATGLIETQKTRLAEKTAGATGTVGFGSSNHNNGRSMFLDVTASAASQYMSVETIAKIDAKASTQYKAYARIENLVADGLTGGQGLQLAVEERGVTSTVARGGYYYSFDGVNDYVISDATHSGNLTATSHLAFSFRFRIDADGTASTDSQPLVDLPYIRCHVRETTNEVQLRYDNAGAKISFYAIGNGNRSRHHVVCAVYNNGSARQRDLYVDNVLRDSDTNALAPSTKYSDYVLMGKYGLSAAYLNGDLRDLHIFKFTGSSFSSTDASRLYQGLQPYVTTGIVEYLNRKTDERTGTTARDRDGNARPGTLTGGVTHADDTSAPFAQTKEIYGIVATNNIVNNRNTKQDFRRTSQISFTTHADCEYFRILAKVLESTGKVSIADIVIDEQTVESVTNPAVADFSSAK